MLSLLSSIFVSILSGGATGLLGVAIQRFFDMKKYDRDIEMKRLENAHEIEIRKQDAELMRLESEAKVQVAQIGGDTAEMTADAQAFQASFGLPIVTAIPGQITKNQNWLYVLNDFIRGLIRPILTTYLCAVMTWIYIDAIHLVNREGMTVSPEEAFELINKVVASALYLATTCVLWWFGTRNKQRPPRVHQEFKP